MEGQINQLLERLSAVGSGWAYVAVALSAFLENLLPPVPGDTVVVFSAYLVGRGLLNWWYVYLATWAGGTAGFLTMYALGRTRGRAWVNRHRRQPFTPENLQRAERWLNRYGVLLILANRFLSGIRSVIAISAGLGRMDWRWVALAAAVSMAVWNGLLLELGSLLGRNWESIMGLVRFYEKAVIGFGVSVAMVLVLVRWFRRRSASASEP